MHLRGSLVCQKHYLHQFIGITSFASLRLRAADWTEWLPWLVLGLVTLVFTLQLPHWLGPVALLGAVAIRSSTAWFSTSLTKHPLFLAIGGWKTVGIVAGMLLFIIITTAANPALAVFDKAEQQATSLFDEYIDGKIISFLFGLLRIVVWITSIGFILFAIYQAQRGEQWLPLMQNAFIVVAAIVVVEGLSSLFFK
jgi:hypothetical protein